MSRFFLVYLLPAALINLGNVFGYLFQITVTRTLSIIDVGAFNTIFALTNFISAPAAILPFVVARTMINTSSIAGAAGNIILRSALGGLMITAVLLTAVTFFIEPIRTTLHVEQSSTIMLGLLLICTNILYCLAVGWLQGNLRYIASSLALASIPILRCLFGLCFLVFGGGGVDSATIATALPGAVLFVACFVTLYKQIDQRRGPLPAGTWRDFGRFLLSSSLSSVLLLGFWNLDIVTVRALFSPTASGLYAVAAILGRIPYLLSVAVVNVLFSEATVASLGADPEPAAKRVLFINFALAATLGAAAAIPLSVFAEPVLVLFGGSEYAASAPVLRLLSFTMALLALLQILVTYMLARAQQTVLVLLAAGLAVFLALGRFCAHNPLEIVSFLMGTIGTLIVICLLLVLVKPGWGKRTSRDMPAAVVDDENPHP